MGASTSPAWAVGEGAVGEGAAGEKAVGVVTDPEVSATVLATGADPGNTSRIAGRIVNRSGSSASRSASRSGRIASRIVSKSGSSADRSAGRAEAVPSNLRSSLRAG